MKILIKNGTVINATGRQKINVLIENDKILMTHNDQTEECEYKDGKITLTADGTTMIQRKPTAMIFQYIMIGMSINQSMIIHWI